VISVYPCSRPLEAAAVDLGAGARRDVDPRSRVSRLFGFACAGVRGRLAVVLRNGCNAIALLSGELGGRRRLRVGKAR